MPDQRVVTKLLEEISRGPRRLVEARAAWDRKLELEELVNEPVYKALDELREAR